MVKGAISDEEGNRGREREQQEHQLNNHTPKVLYITFILFENNKSKITMLSVGSNFSINFKN